MVFMIFGEKLKPGSSSEAKYYIIKRDENKAF